MVNLRGLWEVLQDGQNGQNRSKWSKSIHLPSFEDLQNDPFWLESHFWDGFRPCLKDTGLRLTKTRKVTNSSNSLLGPKMVKNGQFAMRWHILIVNWTFWLKMIGFGWNWKWSILMVQEVKIMIFEGLRRGSERSKITENGSKWSFSVWKSYLSQISQYMP